MDNIEAQKQRHEHFKQAKSLTDIDWGYEVEWSDEYITSRCRSLE